MDRKQGGASIVLGGADSAQAELAQMVQLLLPFAIRGLATLGVADVLASGPVPVEKIAAEVGANTDALYRTLRYTASKGVFQELPGRAFALTPTAEYLRSDVTGSMRNMLVIEDSNSRALQMYTKVVHTLRTGESAYQKAEGASLYDNSSDGRAPKFLCRGNPQKKIDQLLEAVDFSADQTVVDVGGGNGLTLGTILTRNPQLTGVLLELPYAVEEATPMLEKLGVAERCELISGDMFAEVPSGADTYLLSCVIHNWPDDKARVILGNVRAAMPDTARLLIFEPLITGDGPQSATLTQMDFMMLLNSAGRERSATEHETLLTDSGFRLAAVTEISPGYYLVEARPS